MTTRTVSVSIPRRKTFYVYSTPPAVPDGVLVIRTSGYIVDRQIRYVVARV